MNYDNIIDELNKNINKILLSKQEEKKEYIPMFIKMYGNPKQNPKQNNDMNSFYLNKMNETVKNLSKVRDKFSSNKDFYETVAKLFAQDYIPKMIEEYEITDIEILNKLSNIQNGYGIKIFDRGEAKKYAEQFGDTINGDVGAFKYHDMICFTPDNESNKNQVSEEESIMNATKMLSSMIHETMHILINVTKEEYFNYANESKLTSGGSILNEGLVEMHALDFAKKYNLVHWPALFYINNVEMCRNLKLLLGEETFENLAFSGTYEEMIPPELLEQYQIAERTRYYSRKGYDINPNQIDLSGESIKKF